MLYTVCHIKTKKSNSSIKGNGLGRKQLENPGHHKYNRQERHRKLLRQYREEKEKGCERCGYNKCHQAIHYHHLDPSTKKYNIATAVSSQHLAWETVQEEMSKCIRVCSNCHYEIHAEEDWNPKIIGSMTE